MSAEPTRTASDFANAIEDQVKLVRYYRTLTSDRSRIDQRISELRLRADELTTQADRLEADLTDAPALEDKALAEIKTLRAGLVLHRERGKVNTIARLADQLSELDPVALAAVMAALEERAATEGGAE